MKSLKKLNAGVTDDENTNETSNSNSAGTTSSSMHSNIPTSYVSDV